MSHQRTTAAVLYLGTFLFAHGLPLGLAAAAEVPFVFRDVGAEAGLLPDVGGIRGHAAGWGDVDGDGWIDLYVGTFGNQGSKPNLFFRNRRGRFGLDGQEGLQVTTRANAALFVDLDGDGDLDLYVSGMPGVVDGLTMATSRLFRNDGGGRFSDVSEASGACPADLAGRSAAALDHDGDGRLDLVVGDDPFPLYKGRKRTRLFHNRGGLTFEEAPLPAAVPALGVAAGDLDGDGWPDLFVAGRDGGNRLFLNDGRGGFREPPSLRDRFAWDFPSSDDTSAGVALGDVDRDGRLDILVGHHFKRPWMTPVPIRLYLNRGGAGADPAFEEIALEPLPLKAPHVEIQDFDNDGWPDLYASIVKFSDGAPHPLIFRNLGVAAGQPRFRERALAANDFPTAEDRAIADPGKLFDKALRERKALYTAGGPSADYDNDGRLDLFLVSFWLEMPSLLLRNETRGGRWLDVEVRGRGRVNPAGIGARVRIFRAGRAGLLSALIGHQEIAATAGYVSNRPAVAHFGLGAERACDVEVRLPHGRGRLLRRNVRADQRLVLEVR